MAPKKKSSSSSAKKSNQNQQQSQPSKFGIQHFFERHTQNSQKPKNVQSPQTSISVVQPQTTPPSTLSHVTSITDTSKEDDDICEVSPETSKSGTFKRFKFSPGMLIKQSQDDGAERVSWRISPVDVKAVTKRKPEIIRVLADASNLNASNFRHCSNKESSISIEEWISSPTLKAPERSLVSSKEVSMREVNQNQDVDTHSSCSSGNDKNKTNTIS